ncbi:MAG: amidohydrolase [Chloroflexi bacterium]|nr:amidohydrolase [Chloroflexota bacterium]
MSLIVDAQVHVWAFEQGEPTRGRLAHRAGLWRTEEMLAAMDAAGVDRAVIVPPPWADDRNAYALAAARAFPDRFAVMGLLEPNEPDTAERLEHWLEQPGMVGLRFTLYGPPWRNLFRAGGYEPVWSAAERLGIPIMVSAAGLLAELPPVLERHPGLRLIVDHLGRLVATRGPRAWADFPDLLALARFPNLATKGSALPCFSEEGYPFRDLGDYLRRAYDAFGPQRLLWATDYSRLPCTYEQAIDHVRSSLDFLSEEDKEWILGRAAMEWLSWPLI